MQICQMYLGKIAWIEENPHSPPLDETPVFVDVQLALHSGERAMSCEPLDLLSLINAYELISFGHQFLQHFKGCNLFIDGHQFMFQT